MTKNPLINALTAITYIVILVSGITLIPDNGFDSSIVEFVAPILMISLFTLSAAVMGYLFCYQPLRLYLEGEKKNAVSLFLKTVALFAIFPIILFVLYLLGIFS